MQSVGSTSPPPLSPSKGKSLFLLILIALICVIISLLYFGSTDVHDGSKHLLYDAFDLSPPHATLLKQLKKSKLSILWGRKEEGLFQFAEHFGNQLVLDGRAVFLE